MYQRNSLLLSLVLAAQVSVSLAFMQHRAPAFLGWQRRPDHRGTTLPPTSAPDRGRRANVQCRAQLPSVEELATDPFMKQVSHAETIVPLLSDPANEQVVERIQAQLGHSDGIRGFFVTYLTMMGDDTPADQASVPPALLTAMKGVENEKELVSLACMNVIMPTGMITMHQDEELSQQSQITAERGVRLLRALREKATVKEECEAILAVASGQDNASVDSTKVAFWEDFFGKWGYGDIQKRDIAQAVQSVLSE
jgi:hypothetical protein